MWGWILENLTRISFENLVLCENICHWNGNQTIIHVQFYHLHILMTLDSFKQLWELIFFKCKGYIFKGKPSSNVKVCNICPLDHCKPTRCCYLGAPLLLWMGMVEVGGSMMNVSGGVQWGSSQAPELSASWLSTLWGPGAGSLPEPAGVIPEFCRLPLWESADACLCQGGTHLPLQWLQRAWRRLALLSWFLWMPPHVHHLPEYQATKRIN